MKLGAHLSIAKGLPALLAEADSYGMNAIQVFARNPRGRGETKIAEEDAAVFRAELKKRDWPLVIHAPYYVNVGSGTPNNQRIAREVTKLDLEKGDLLGASYVVVHLGGPGEGFEVEDGTKNAANVVKAILEGTNAKTKLLLETSAGPKKVASRFEQLAEILKLIGDTKRVGVCMDTCHMYVSGYDIVGGGMKDALDAFDHVVGLDQLEVIHCNDTQSTLGVGQDKHWHVGQGNIEEEAFRVLLNDERLKDKTFILETPKENPETGDKDADALNMATLKRLVQ